MAWFAFVRCLLEHARNPKQNLRLPAVSRAKLHAIAANPQIKSTMTEPKEARLERRRRPWPDRVGWLGWSSSRWALWPYLGESRLLLLFASGCSWFRLRRHATPASRNKFVLGKFQHNRDSRIFDTCIREIATASGWDCATKENKVDRELFCRSRLRLAPLSPLFVGLNSGAVWIQAGLGSKEPHEVGVQD